MKELKYDWERIQELEGEIADLEEEVGIWKGVSAALFGTVFILTCFIAQVAWVG